MISMYDGDGQLFTFREFYLSTKKNTFRLLAPFDDALDNLEIKPYNLCIK
jgi:hypothetical protein